VYANINGSGIKGGHKRLGFESVNDYNREWLKGSPLATVAATRNAIASDTGGSANVLLDWHSTSDNRGDYTTIESDTYGLANNTTWNTLAASYFDMSNADIGAVDSATGYVINWAYTTLGTDYSTHAEHANRGNNSAANLENVGRAWLRTLQAADAGGMFYTIPAGDAIANLNKSNCVVANKALNLLSDVIVNLNKSNLSVESKLLSTQTDSGVDAAANVLKGNANVLARVLQSVSSNATDAVAILNKSTMLVSGKLLSAGRAPHPIGKSRIFFVEVDARTFFVID
jgi:hypothetical protein